jgi:cation:H+ antiporter
MVKGATGIAKRARMSEFLIGLTIIGFGTSTPELIISLTSGAAGRGDIAIGNIVGSNTANILLILGLAALVRPIKFTRQILRFDMPFMMLSAVLMLLFAYGLTFWSAEGGVMQRWEGIVFLALFAVFIWYSFREGSTKAPLSRVKHTIPRTKPKPVKEGRWHRFSKSLAWMIFITAGGLAAVVWGADIFVSAASAIAHSLGVSDAVIAITIVAVGTSSPELVTSLVAAAKGNTQLSLGNIVGSNIFNSLFILGLSSSIFPLSAENIAPMDFYANIAASGMLWLSVVTFKRFKLDRADGVIFILVYAAYVYLLITR